VHASEQERPDVAEARAPNGEGCSLIFKAA
jgi:hypothetical protein